jgi:hypothetical protein
MNSSDNRLGEKSMKGGKYEICNMPSSDFHDLFINVLGFCPEQGGGYPAEQQ